jgi:hypothetical protein
MVSILLYLDQILFFLLEVFQGEYMFELNILEYPYICNRVKTIWNYLFKIVNKRGSRPRWLDNIKMDLRAIGWSCVKWIVLVQNKDRWRAFWDTALTFGLNEMFGAPPTSCGRSVSIVLSWTKATESLFLLMTALIRCVSGFFPSLSLSLSLYIYIYVYIYMGQSGREPKSG